MKKILIATTNKDKYQVVTYLLDKAGLSKNKYLYYSLDDINYDGPDKKEQGSINDRAKEKALVVKQYLPYNDFEYIVGIDDGIFIKGALQENIKDYVGKILYEDYLADGEDYAFYRGYCIIAKDGTMYETRTKTPYIYKSKEDAEYKEYSYPLSQVSVPVGNDVAVSE